MPSGSRIHVCASNSWTVDAPSDTSRADSLTRSTVSMSTCSGHFVADRRHVDLLEADLERFGPSRITNGSVSGVPSQRTRETCDLVVVVPANGEVLEGGRPEAGERCGLTAVDDELFETGHVTILRDRIPLLVEVWLAREEQPPVETGRQVDAVVVRDRHRLVTRMLGEPAQAVESHHEDGGGECVDRGEVRPDDGYAGELGGRCPVRGSTMWAPRS